MGTLVRGTKVLSTANVSRWLTKRLTSLVTGFEMLENNLAGLKKS